MLIALKTALLLTTPLAIISIVYIASVLEQRTANSGSSKRVQHANVGSAVVLCNCRRCLRSRSRSERGIQLVQS